MGPRRSGIPSLGSAPLSEKRVALTPAPPAARAIGIECRGILRLGTSRRATGRRSPHQTSLRPSSDVVSYSAFTRRRDRVEQRRTAGALPRPLRAGASRCCSIAQAGRSPAPAASGVVSCRRVFRQQQARAAAPGRPPSPPSRLLSQRCRRRRLLRRRGQLLDQGGERNPGQVDCLGTGQREQMVQRPR